MLQSDANNRELLAWYVDAGVDLALCDDPVDRFKQAATQKVATKPKPGAPANSSPPSSKAKEPFASKQVQQKPSIPDATAVALAVESATKASTLKELRAAIDSFQGCNLKFTARTTVFSDGDPSTKIMFVGGAPGLDEDAQGVPYAGQAGQLLDRMLHAIGLSRSHIYIANCAPWRPPGGRAMSPAEVELCRPFAERHIQLADPDILILAGGVSAKLILKNKRDITGLRGKWTEFHASDRSIPTLPILSPDYLLKNPQHKGLAWQDLLSIKARLNQSQG